MLGFNGLWDKEIERIVKSLRLSESDILSMPKKLRIMIFFPPLDPKTLGENIQSSFVRMFG